MRDLYLETIKRAVTNYHFLGGSVPFDAFESGAHYDMKRSRWTIDPLSRPFTLLSSGQLDLLQDCILQVERAGVPGDLIEAGIWRGGAVAFMRALIAAYDIPGRSIVAADSFAGIPKNGSAVADPVDQWPDRWEASLAEVRANIDRLGLLDDRIEFVPGLFSESLGALAGRQFALIRLDSDSYDSVTTSLEHLYPGLAPGGIVIIDDWHLSGCVRATIEYRARHSITEAIRERAGNVYWVKC